MEPFMGEIRVFSFSFAPRGWAQCNGQLLPINQNQALFALLGITYGGNGQTNFALPNLVGKVAISQGDHNQGETGGENAHTLTANEMPTHIHFLQASQAQAATNVPSNTATLAASNGAFAYTPASNLTGMSPSFIGNVGGSQAHENRQPYLVLNFCIALQGIFPSQN